MPRSGYALVDHLCVRADVRTAGQLSATAGGAVVTLAFPASGLQRVCTAIAPAPGDDGIALAMTLRDGDIAIHEVQLYDHVQYGGLRRSRLLAYHGTSRSRNTTSCPRAASSRTSAR